MSNSDKSKGIPGMAFIASLENFLNRSVLEKNFAMLIRMFQLEYFHSHYVENTGTTVMHHHLQSQNIKYLRFELSTFKPLLDYI